MSTNEMGHDVPPAVEAAAARMNCWKGVKYIYRDGDYPSVGPATSIDCQRRAVRVHPKRFETHKIDLGSGWVAFRALGPTAAAMVLEPLAEGELPDLPKSRDGKITERFKIDGTPLKYRVDKQDLFHAPSNPKKAYLLQKLRMDDGKGFDEGHDEFRIAYYMIGYKGRARNKWAFGQFAPIMTPEDLVAIVQRMKNLGWLPDAVANPLVGPPTGESAG